MSHLFPYGITLQEGGKVALFPAAEVQFETKDGDRLSIFLIIDSGATISALPKTDAETFGVQLEQGMPMDVAGIVGKSIKGWRHILGVRIRGEVLQIPFVFLDTEDPFRVLGREGVFDQFTVVFEETKRRTGFLAEGTQEALSVRDILNTL